MPQLILFQTGNMHFALERNAISHIGSPTAGFSSDLCRVLCRTAVHKGCSLALIDLAATLDQDSKRPYPPELKIIMLKTAPYIGLPAEQVHGVLDVDAQQMEVLPPVFTGKARACFQRIVRLDDHLVLVIDAASLPELLPDDWQSAAENKPPVTQKEDRTERSHATKDRPGMQEIEALIVRKFQDIIGRQVKRLLSQAMAEAVAKCEVRI